MIIKNNLTGEVFEVEDVQPIEMEMSTPQPTVEERLDALELALLEVVLNS